MNRRIGGIAHVGITVADLDRAKKFYGRVLGLAFKGQMVMEGDATDRLFGMEGCRVHVAYFNGTNRMGIPPVELLYFENREIRPCVSELDRVSLSELCFYVKRIDQVYEELVEKGVVFLSAPQYFDLSDQGFGRSKAVYLRDSEGNILELIEACD
ncbi:MAG: VOC family protein [Cellulosilyticaceae bacterium]